MNVCVLCNSDEQLYAALSNEYVNEIVMEADKVDEPVITLCHENGKKAAIALPYVFRDITYVDVEGYDEVYVRSLDELEYYKDKKLVTDYSMYSMNPVAAKYLRSRGVERITAPIELNEHELKTLDCKDKELIVYGHIPMMVSAQCIHKNINGCDKIPQIMPITDRTGKHLSVENKCTYCYNLIYNTVPISLAGIWNKVEKLDPRSVRINLTVEDSEESIKIINAFVKAIQNGRADDPVEFTRGHFLRGVE